MATLTPELAHLMARRFALLGEPTRLRLLDTLRERGEASVGELAKAVGASHAAVSKHLGLMLSERIVSRRRDGSRALYSLADATVIRLCDEVSAGMRDQLRELSALMDEPLRVAR